MLTDLKVTVDRPAALLLTITELAKRKGVSKQAVSKRVARLQTEGKLTIHAGERGSRLVSLAEFDKAIGETTDLGRETAAATVRGSRAVDPVAGHVYTDEQARHMAYKADLARLDLDERLGKLVAVDKFADAGARIAEALVRVLDGLASRADDVASAVAKDGVTGARAVLKGMGRDLREALNRELVTLADLAGAQPVQATPDEDAET